MISSTDLIASFCRATSKVKRVNLDPKSVETDSYLGGDWGIDSMEMLEIWFHMEKENAIRLPDGAKRDVYTVGQVVEVFKRHLTTERSDPP